jgi:hypothetical protein
MHGTVEQHRRGDPVHPQSSGEGGGFPVPVRDRGTAALALRRPAAQTGHLRGSAGFVDENQFFRVEIELAVEPVLALREDVRALLLAGMARLYGMARPFSPAWTMMPVFETGKAANRCLS